MMQRPIATPGMWSFTVACLEMIFHPRTAGLLGENHVQVEEDSTVDVESGGRGAIYPSGTAGTLFYTATYLASGITDSMDEMP